MIKITLLITTLLIAVTSSWPGLIDPPGKENPVSKYSPAPMNFSFDMQLMSYSRVEGGTGSNRVQPHRLFEATPRKQRWHVAGQLGEQGISSMRIDLLQKDVLPWINLSNPNPDSRSNISYFLVDGNSVRAFDEKGNQRIRLDTGVSGWIKNFRFLIRNEEVENAWQQHIRTLLAQGGQCYDQGGERILSWEEAESSIRMHFDRQSGLPLWSEIIRSDQKTKISYTFECIDGKYVLVLQRTSITRQNPDADEPIVEFISQIELENIQFNQ